MATATTGWPRWRARSDMRTIAIPSANVNRPTARFVTVDTDEARAGRNRTSDAARRAGHVMATRHGMRRNGAPEKLRAAEDQQSHWFPPRLICQSNVISSHRHCSDDDATKRT